MCSTEEVRAALRQLWPSITDAEVDRGFLVADEDSSGHLSALEFKMLVGFIKYFNAKRHALAELDANFGEVLGEREAGLVMGGKVIISANVYLNVLNNSHDRTIVCIFEHIQWRWALNNFTAHG